MSDIIIAKNPKWRCVFFNKHAIFLLPYFKFKKPWNFGTGQSIYHWLIFMETIKNKLFTVATVSHPLPLRDAFLLSGAFFTWLCITRHLIYTMLIDFWSRWRYVPSPQVLIFFGWDTRPRLRYCLLIMASLQVKTFPDRLHRLFIGANLCRSAHPPTVHCPRNDFLWQTACFASGHKRNDASTFVLLFFRLWRKYKHPHRGGRRLQPTISKKISLVGTFGFGRIILAPWAGSIVPERWTGWEMWLCKDL